MRHLLNFILGALSSLLVTVVVFETGSQLPSIDIRAGAVNNQAVAAPPPIYMTMDEVVDAANHDLFNEVSPESRPFTRYLTAYYAAHDWREAEDWRLLSSAACNFLSSRARIQVPLVVAHTKQTLFRINIRDYGWSGEEWETLAKENFYFNAQFVRTDKQIEETTVKSEKFFPAGKNADGSPYKAGLYPVTQKLRTEFFQQTLVFDKATWVDGVKLDNLSKATGTVAPIMRADFFLSRALRPPHYYNFLRIPEKEEELVKNNIGIDLARGARLEQDRQAVLMFSGVSEQNRRLYRIAMPDGAYWISTDGKTSVANEHYLEVVLDRRKANFDASEQIWTLANGLHGFFICNNQGVRQDSVPDFIAHNKLCKGNDARIHNGVSCIVCHENGIIPFRSDWNRLVAPGITEILSPDIKSLERLKQLYDDDDLYEKIEADQARYNAAVKKATLGKWDGPKLSAKLGHYYHEYFEQPVTLEKAALDMGVPPAKLVEILEGTKRPALRALLAQPPLPIRRDYWEVAFSDAAVRCQPYLQEKRRPGDNQ